MVQLRMVKMLGVHVGVEFKRVLATLNNNVVLLVNMCLGSKVDAC